MTSLIPQTLGLLSRSLASNLGVVGKLKAKGNVAIIFNSLKESLDDVTSLVQFSVEKVFHLEV